MNDINAQRQKWTKDLQLINDLETVYINAWNKHPKSAGKGPATGKSFEEWTREKLKQGGKKVERGVIGFRFGRFSVDAAIPSLKNPKIILEIKKIVDVQHALALGGLFDQLPSSNIKIGLVTFYEPGTFYRNPNGVKNILDYWKEKFHCRFDYFHIRNDWSNAIARLLNFC